MSGGGGGGGGNFLFMEYTDVRVEWPPFFSAAKYMIDPIFMDWYMKGPTFLMYPGTCTYLSFRDIPRLFALLVLNELTATFV